MVKCCSELGVEGWGVQSQPELQTVHSIPSYRSDTLPVGRFLWLLVFVFKSFEC